MFHGPLLHLGPGLFAGQLALEDLGVDRLALGAKLLDEGLLFGCRIGKAVSPESGTEARPHTCPHTGLHASPRPSADTVARSSGEAAAPAPAAPRLEGVAPGESAAEPTRLPKASVHLHPSKPLALQLAHLPAVCELVRFDPSQTINARERPGLQGTLRKGRDRSRSDRHGET
ncbi:MAG: hypothetical protein ACYC7F_01790 [Gemmatimonadaceae bacterium]